MFTLKPFRSCYAFFMQQEIEGTVKNKNSKAGCGLGCLHYFATIFFNLLLISEQMRHMRRGIPTFGPTTVERVSHVVYSVFEFPLMNLARSIWHTKAEYFAVLLIWPLNSLLFGFGLIFWMRKINRGKLKL